MAITITISYILIEAQLVLNFLSSREFQPAKFLEKFLDLWHSEPQFSYKSTSLIYKDLDIFAAELSLAPAKLDWVSSFITTDHHHN